MVLSRVHIYKVRIVTTYSKIQKVKRREDEETQKERVLSSFILLEDKKLPWRERERERERERGDYAILLLKR